MSTPCGLTELKHEMNPNNHQPSTIVFTYQPYRRAETSDPRCDSEWALSDLPNMRIRKYPLGELPSSIPPTARRRRLRRSGRALQQRLKLQKLCCIFSCRQPTLIFDVWEVCIFANRRLEQEHLLSYFLHRPTYVLHRRQSQHTSKATKFSISSRFSFLQYAYATVHTGLVSS